MTITQHHRPRHIRGLQFHAVTAPSLAANRPDGGLDERLGGGTLGHRRHLEPQVASAAAVVGPMATNRA